MRADEGLTFRLEATIPEPAARIFSAFVDAPSLEVWWGPHGFRSSVLELDVREGGRYRIRMCPPDGDAFHLTGRFRSVHRPEHLVLTFAWEEPDPDDRETEVVVTFASRLGETLVVVEQGVFATRARLDLHRSGWSEALERLRDHFSS